MSLQDKTVVRSAADLERKYNLSKLLGLTKNIETNNEALIKVENELNEFIYSTTSDIENIQKQLDGNITTYYYSGVPSLSTIPTSEWAVEEYSNHIGDLYYDKDTGYAYRFILDGETNEYKWLELSDSSVSEALAIANAAKDTADSKRRIFVVQPTTPYDNGDLWVQGTGGDIMVCQVSKASGDYSSGDWIIASKYTDDTVANAIVDEIGGNTTTVLGGTVTQYTKNWVKFTDLSTGGSTTIAGDNITTGAIKSQNYMSKTSGMKIDLDNGILDSKNLQLDENGDLNIGGYVKTDRGVVSNLQFATNSGLIGQYYYIYEGITITQGRISAYINIPENFEMLSAKVTLFTQKTLNIANNPTTYEEMTANGKVQHIKLYKQDVSGEIVNGQGYIDENRQPSMTEISGAFGTDGYTAESIEGNSVTSVDIASSLDSGLNVLCIKTSDEPYDANTYTGVKNAIEQCQYAYAFIDIIGYLKLT